MAKQERAVHTRNALIASAAELFDRDGYDAASLSTISARAGVSSGALHFHFTTKSALAHAVGQAAAQRLDSITDQKTNDALQTLINATHALLWHLQHDAVLRAGFSLNDNPKHAHSATDLRTMWHRWIHQTLMQATREGALTPGPHTRNAATTVIAITTGLETLGRHNSWWHSTTPLTHFWHLLLPALTTPPHLDTLNASGTHPHPTTSTSPPPPPETN